ncbi:hypothetical protein LOCC1_G004697, partial [Lachnellula occidentalis]
LLPLKTPPPLSEDLLDKLSTAQSVLSSSGHPFHFYQQIEDPSFLYIIGTWDSPATHAQFLPSAPNQQLLASLTPFISLSEILMYHIDTDISAPVPGKKGVLEAQTISLNRHFVEAGKKGAFGERCGEVKRVLEGYTEPFCVVGGWRIEKDVEKEGQEEWVLLSGFESAEHYSAFAETKGTKVYEGIAGIAGAFEVRHLRRLEGMS